MTHDNAYYERYPTLDIRCALCGRRGGEINMRYQCFACRCVLRKLSVIYRKYGKDAAAYVVGRLGVESLAEGWTTRGWRFAPGAFRRMPDDWHLSAGRDPGVLTSNINRVIVALARASQLPPLEEYAPMRPLSENPADGAV